MCEIFGVYGWREGLKLEKYLADHFLVRGINRFVPHAFNPGENQGSHTYYDLMIPQTHSEKIGENGWPALVLEYTPSGGVGTTAQVLLKDIYTDPDQGVPTLISSWERGMKYVYFVKLALDGGVQVHVTTSAWDPVEAETPGLLLPTF